VSRERQDDDAYELQASMMDDERLATELLARALKTHKGLTRAIMREASRRLVAHSKGA